MRGAKTNPPRRAEGGDVRALADRLAADGFDLEADWDAMDRSTSTTGRGKVEVGAAPGWRCGLRACCCAGSGRRTGRRSGGSSVAVLVEGGTGSCGLLLSCRAWLLATL